MTGRIPDQFIDDLLSRIDIVEIIAARLALKKAGSNYQALCPFHTERSASFTVSPGKQFYHCFGCGAHGTAIRFLMEYDRLEFREAVETLARHAGVKVPVGTGERRDGGIEELVDLTERVAELYRGWLKQHPDRHRAVDYLKTRGLSGDIAARFGMGYAPAAWDSLIRAVRAPEALQKTGLAIARENGGFYDRFRDRVMFPIRDRRGRVVGFGGRVIDDGEPKYLNSPDTPLFHKGREIYGLYECLQAEGHPAAIVVVEGYMDVVALAQHGIDNAVATLGTATGTYQVERLFQTTPNVIFCFDGDNAGRQAAWRALENALPAMRDDRQARFLFLPEGEDPDSLVRKEGAEAFTNRLGEDALPLSDFLFQTLRQDADLGSRDGSARLTARAAPLIRRLPPGIYRNVLVETLADMAKVSTGHIEAALRDDGGPRRPGKPAPPAASRHIARTPMRVAIAALLQNPALAAQAGEPSRWDANDAPGIKLLRQLLELLLKEPHLTTGAILERYRESDDEAALWKLATLDLPGDIEKEFADALQRLDDAALSQRKDDLYSALHGASFEDGLSRLKALNAEIRLQYLRDKQRQNALDEGEIDELNALLAARQ